MKYWPSPQDFSEAIQTPKLSFEDEELKEGSVETTALGLPKCMSGNFASVFPFNTARKKYAIRCFLHDVPDQQARYRSISEFISNDDLPYTVTFDYLERGIKIKGDWFPILKMEWVEGVTLFEYVKKRLTNDDALNLMASCFKQMVGELSRAGIAHGDLQHDNIMVSDNELRLVDYDGMFVPKLRGLTANELGHPNYQHSARMASTFDARLDQFSAWVIFASLKILSIDHLLFEKLGRGDDCFLFRHSDFVEPEKSEAFTFLAGHGDKRVRQYAAAVRKFASGNLDGIPSLNVPVQDLDLDDAVTVVSLSVSAINSEFSGLPGWLRDADSFESKATLENQEPIVTMDSLLKKIHQPVPAAAPVVSTISKSVTYPSLFGVQSASSRTSQVQTILPGTPASMLGLHANLNNGHSGNLNSYRPPVVVPRSSSAGASTQMNLGKDKNIQCAASHVPVETDLQDSLPQETLLFQCLAAPNSYSDEAKGRNQNLVFVLRLALCAAILVGLALIFSFMQFVTALRASYAGLWFLVVACLNWKIAKLQTPTDYAYATTNSHLLVFRKNLSNRKMLTVYSLPWNSFENIKYDSNVGIVCHFDKKGPVTTDVDSLILDVSPTDQEAFMKHVPLLISTSP